MLKNKSKLLLIILMVITLALSPLSFADDEEEKVDTEEAVETLKETTEETINESEKPTEDTIEEETIEENNAEDLTKHGDQYLVGDSITVDNTIDGNLYVLAKEVTINAQVVGNAFICAEKVTLSAQGYISNSLFIAASDITVEGISYDLYSVSKNLTLTGYIFRDIHCAASDISLFGTVGRDAFISAENFTFEKKDSATSEEDGSTVEFVSAQGRIMGNLDYSSKEEKSIPEGAVEGKVNFEASKEFKLTPNYFLSTIYFMILALAVWAVFKWLAPKFLEKTDKLLTYKVGKTVGFGLLGLVTVPVVAILFLILNVTGSVGLLLLSAYFFVLSISAAVTLTGLTNILAKKFNFEGALKTILLLLVLALVTRLITFVPYVGALVSIVLAILGVGIVVRSLVSKKDKEEIK